MNKNILAITGLLIALFLYPTLFLLVPVFSIIAEVYAFYLDRQKVPKKTRSIKSVSLTWQQLREYNTESQAYIAIDKKVYDITEFLDVHPGGKEYLLMNSGRDATLAFNCYHPFTQKPQQLLQKYLVGDLKTTEQPEFAKDSGFYRECSEKLKEYFEKNKINPKSLVPGLVRAIPLWSFMIIVFDYTFIAKNAFWCTIIGAVLFGIMQALNTLHLMHDASHSAAGKTELSWWFFGRWTLDYLSGSSMLAWHNQHVIGHHIYTNVMGSDPDVPQKKEGDVRRLTWEQTWVQLYRYQQYYMPVLYGLLSLRSRYYDIFEIFLLETNGPVKVNPISLQNQLRQASSKLFWLFWRFYLPVHVFNLEFSTFIILFLVAEFSTGYWLAINFQVSHVSDAAEFFYNDTEKVIQKGTNDQWSIEWAILQVKSSVDYAHNSWLMTYLCGALNYQVVHHLFPGVSQYYYPQIAPIVKDVCKKYKIKYNELGTFKEAWDSHINHLTNLGKQQKFVGFKLE